MLIQDVIQVIENWAAPALQENYDNAGLICGNRNETLTGVLICLDCIESVIDEAIEHQCNLVIAHHPIVFKGLKSITGKNYVERTLLKAIKNDIAIYAAHTNLDSIQQGVNAKITEKLGLENCKILAPKKQFLEKITVFVPPTHAEKVLDAMHNAGAGNIGNYSHCSFSVNGIGTFKGNENSNPQIGEKGKIESVQEQRIEVIVPQYLSNKVLQAMKKAHPYEEVAYYQTTLQNEWQDAGSGVIGTLPQPMSVTEFLQHIKATLPVNTIKYTPFEKDIQKVAVCGGSGSFLLGAAKAAQADAFITADFKYHEFFDAEKQLLIADIGHYESEFFTIELIFEYLLKKIPNIAARLTTHNTNPINYF